MAYYAGIDLGATHLRVAITEGDGTILARVDRDTPQGPTGEAVTEAVVDALQTVCAELGLQPPDVTAVGIGSIGPLDRTNGAVTTGVNLNDDIGRIALRSPLRSTINGPVTVVNDAIAGAIGERAALSTPTDHLVYLTISTGIGVGAIVDGHVLQGRHGNAGELGHIVVDPSEQLPCGCGGAGHWEAYCSGRNLPALARLLTNEEGDGMEWGTAADLFGHPNHPTAKRTLRRMTRYNAIGLATAIHAYAPAVVSVGGAVALENPDRVIDRLARAVPERLAVDPPEIRAAALGRDSVLRGAIETARSHSDR